MLGGSWEGPGTGSVSGHLFGIFPPDSQRRAGRTPDQRSLPLLRCLQALGRFLRSSPMMGSRRSSHGKVLAINPDNLDAKTDLGICYAEGTTTPMQGIMLLREVVEKNPGANAQFNLGILSVRSGQYDKALERFSKVCWRSIRRNEHWRVS